MQIFRPRLDSDRSVWITDAKSGRRAASWFQGSQLKIVLMTLKFTSSHLEDSLSLFRYYKKLAEGAMQQVTDQQLFSVLDPEMNSIAILVKHMSDQWPHKVFPGASCANSL